MMDTVMIVGSGAREHALALAYQKSYNVSSVVVTPGNLGMTSSGIDTFPHTNLKDPHSFFEAATIIKPSLIDVAQDDALACGTVDLCVKKGYHVFGPTKAASRIEWDKEWSREFMSRYNIPMPEFRSFKKGDEKSIKYAQDLLDKYGLAFFKASGLYQGKGVIPANNIDNILDAYKKIQNMGDASNTFLVEQGLIGEEFSYYAIVDGKNFKCFKSAQDNKRVYNFDQGPNTGGMGSNSPALVTKGLEQRIENEIIAPTVKGLSDEGIPYTGILYLGGIVCDDGSLKVIEYNSRWGDPECHVILPGVKNDYYNLVNTAINGCLDNIDLKEDSKTRVCVIGASAGYPENYDAVKGKRLWIDSKHFPEGVHYLSAGIKFDCHNEPIVNGGRVFSIVAQGDDIIEARTKALQGMACCRIADNGLHYKTDIAWRDVQRKELKK